jgi:hypothetical protein
VSGDEALQSLDLSSLALIKIDVEGGELEVLRGLESTISRFKPYIVFEVLPHMIVRTRTELDTTTKEVRDRRHDQIDELLRNTGYTIFRIETVSGIRETSKLQAASHQLFNYIAVPEAEVGSFQQAYSGPVADALPPNN